MALEKSLRQRGWWMDWRNVSRSCARRREKSFHLTTASVMSPPFAAAGFRRFRYITFVILVLLFSHILQPRQQRLLFSLSSSWDSPGYLSSIRFNLSFPTLAFANGVAVRQQLYEGRPREGTDVEEPTAEHFARVGRVMGQEEEEEARSEFHQYDLNGDNFLDGYEVWGTHREISEGEVHGFFLAIDQNSDGLISPAEYLQFITVS